MTICKNDSLIINVGKRLWLKNRSKLDKKGEVRKSVTNSMRRLGSLYLKFKNTFCDLYLRVRVVL